MEMMDSIREALAISTWAELIALALFAALLCALNWIA